MAAHQERGLEADVQVDVANKQILLSMQEPKKPEPTNVALPFPLVKGMMAAVLKVELEEEIRAVRANRRVLVLDGS